MTAINGKSSAHFRWTPAGWFGCQLGCTAFLLTGLVEFLGRDSWMSFFCLTSFVVLNAWGLHLWSLREKLSAYQGVQRFAAATWVDIIILVILVNQRGLTSPVPYWTIAFIPAIMLMVYFQEWSARRREGQSGQQ